ncbi:hypothetical protein CAPTEDRAFT_200661 [Capitella teleta]|uniref:Uncharacterized protein n=1 Tax=Capitella teleta TaxID=283909 RepID=R7U2Q4_CAPTE|nr:hypothetical protein CAPTEDRAFT_200661 [Capitella teleta]|eukprot:ELU00158.1 hypothetical protein CAPTEDRAFT_200661 [Capitella teleta]
MKNVSSEIGKKYRTIKPIIFVVDQNGIDCRCIERIPVSHFMILANLRTKNRFPMQLHLLSDGLRTCSPLNWFVEQGNLMSCYTQTDIHQYLICIMSYYNQIMSHNITDRCRSEVKRCVLYIESKYDGGSWIIAFRNGLFQLETRTYRGIDRVDELWVLYLLAPICDHMPQHQSTLPRSTDVFATRYSLLSPNPNKGHSYKGGGAVDLGCQGQGVNRSSILIMDIKENIEPHKEGCDKPRFLRRR